MAPVFEAKRRSIQGNISGDRSAMAGYPSLVNFMEQKPPQLRHELRAGQMAMVAIGGSIGTGLLLGSGAAVQIAGPGVILSYILGALIAFTVTTALGEMSSLHPAAGSFGVYADKYLNRWAGFISRYGYWFSLVIAISG
ncbi:MAG TPA: amino acid permease, partial [Candidatus Binatus sp.]|nr:amino acid permease [Candidatus Binatus sp.]